MMHLPQPAIETAGHHLVNRLPVFHAEDCVSTVLSQLLGNRFDALDAIYVLREGRLLGLVLLPNLLMAGGSQTLAEIMTVEPPQVFAHEDQEQVAGIAVQYGLASVPVVDDQGYFAGVVPAPALIAILRREHVEDLHRLAGIQRENSQARHALEDPPRRRAFDRLPWLLVGLVGSILATFVVSRFERILEAQVVLAFFVPGIVYLADAIGTQTEAIVVRGLSLSKASLEDLLAGELQTGFLIGLALGVVSFPVVLAGFGNLHLAIAVALTVMVAGAVATSVGLLFPWLLQRVGKDPAFGSGPVATIIQDVLSLLIYFSIAQLLVD
jgi:magnesium transporter